MAATLAPSMAVALQTPPASLMTNKSKDDFRGAGRRKLDKFREKRAAKSKASVNHEPKDNENEKENSERPIESSQPAAPVSQPLPASSTPALPTSLSLTSSDKYWRVSNDGENEKPASATDSNAGALADTEQQKLTLGASTFGANSLVPLSKPLDGRARKSEHEMQEFGTLSLPTSQPSTSSTSTSTVSWGVDRTTWSSTKPSAMVRPLSEGSNSDSKADANEKQALSTSDTAHVPAADTTWSRSKPFSLVKQPSEGSISDLQEDEKKVNENWYGIPLSQSYVERPVDSFLLRPAVPEAPLASSHAASNGSPFYEQNQSHSGSKKDDFDALEQHIEDLTQEKFALQRGLDKSKALVETLSQDNAALTEDYNQQAARVNELKDELVRCQEYILTQGIELNRLQALREKAEQETNAAKERSRSLAAETIQVEENYRRTRSQELKLQKEVEALRDEIESLRKQNASIEKDHFNAISMTEAMQEEKKVLLARIREAADKVVPPPVTSKQDASTATDDLITDDRSSTSVPEPETTDSSPFYPTSLPPEQLSVLENINAVVDELGREKESILRALRNETETVTRLKNENAELSQKLERQTQQLELAVAQNMARAGGSLPSPPVFQTSEEIDYIDEGDEIVDRVLGWIMKLFPGGKRGGVKHM